MTKSQIICFMEVAKHQSFSKAAAQLFISQPAVSKQVAQLERELDLPLFDRTHGAIRLSVVGKLFYDYFLKAHRDFEQVVKEAHQFKNVYVGDIRLGCLDGWDVSTFFPRINRFFQVQYPNLHLVLDGYNHGEVLAALRRGEIDVAITLDISAQGQPDLCVRNITPVEITLLLSAHHPNAGRENLSLTDFQDDTFFVILPPSEPDPAMEGLTLELCEQAGFRPQIEYAPSSAAVLMRLQAGNGVTVTTEWTSACRSELYRAQLLGRKVHMCVAWLDDGQNPAKSTFVNELIFFYRQEEN